MGSTVETELTHEHPLHVVCDWIGNTERIATRHSLQVDGVDFNRATSIEMRPDAELSSKEQKAEIRLAVEDGSNSQC